MAWIERCPGACILKVVQVKCSRGHSNPKLRLHQSSACHIELAAVGPPLATKAKKLASWMGEGARTSNPSSTENFRQRCAADNKILNLSNPSLDADPNKRSLVFCRRTGSSKLCHVRPNLGRSTKCSKAKRKTKSNLVCFKVASRTCGELLSQSPGELQLTFTTSRNQPPCGAPQTVAEQAQLASSSLAAMTASNEPAPGSGCPLSQQQPDRPVCRPWQSQRPHPLPSFYWHAPPQPGSMLHLSSTCSAHPCMSRLPESEDIPKAQAPVPPRSPATRRPSAV